MHSCDLSAILPCLSCPTCSLLKLEVLYNHLCELPLTNEVTAAVNKLLHGDLNFSPDGEGVDILKQPHCSRMSCLELK